MEDFEHFIDIAVAVIILFLFPLLYFGQKQDTLTQTYVRMETKELVDEIRSTGYLTKDKYDRYLEALSDTDLLYDITLDHQQTVYEPEYRFHTPEEIIDEQNGSFTGTNTYQYRPVSTEVPSVVDPIDNSGLTMNTETNESIMASAVATPASPNHVHTNECYGDTGHIHGVFGKNHEHSTSYTDSEGKTINCYAPPMQVKFRSRNVERYGEWYVESEIAIYCRECYEYMCGAQLSVNSSGNVSLGYVDIRTPYQMINIRENTVAINQFKSLYNILYSNSSKYWSSDYYYISFKEGEFIYDFPYRGKIRDCGNCNDIKLTYRVTSEDEFVTVTCQHCRQVIANVSRTGGENNAFISMVNNIVNVDNRDPSFFFRSDTDVFGTTFTLMVPRNWEGLNFSFLQEPLNHGCHYGDFLYCNNRGYINCFAGKIHWDSEYNPGPSGYSNTYDLYCAECRVKLYTISQYYSNISSQYNSISVTDFSKPIWGTWETYTLEKYDPGYADAKQKYDRFANLLSTKSYNGEFRQGGYEVKTLPRGLLQEIPIIGQFTGCKICRDYTLEYSADYSTVSLYNTHLNKYTGYFTSYGMYLYNTPGNYEGTWVVNKNSTPEYNAFWERTRQIISGQNIGANWVKRGQFGEHIGGGVPSGMSLAIHLPYNADVLSFDFLRPIIQSQPKAELYGIFTYCGQNITANCNRIVVSITPTHPVQAVYVNEPLITTALVSYLDGSAKTSICSADFIPNTPIQNKSVTLTHIDDYTRSHTCNITVTVIPKTKTCTNGHTYNLNNDGTDPGCIYCDSWLASLSVYHPPTNSITIYRGTTLPDNEVTLLATYMNGRAEYITNEYVDNLDRYYVGTQNATISYKGKYVNLTVITKRNIIQCDVCHRFYELYPDDTNPGCPYCQSRTPIFTGNVMEYVNENYSKDILKELYEESGTYYFNQRDYILLTLANTSASWGTRILRNIYNGLGENNIHVTYGRYVSEDTQ